MVCAFFSGCIFLSGSMGTVIGPVNMEKCKSNFKIGSHGSIHIFKNYFATVFLVFSNKQYPNRPLYLKPKRYKRI